MNQICRLVIFILLFPVLIHGQSRFIQRLALRATDDSPILNENFGFAVAINSRNTVFIGAPIDDDNGDNSGSAYIFGMTAVQRQKILAFDGAFPDMFGREIAVSTDTMVVGARHDNAKGTNSGSAYVLRWNGTVWLQSEKLVASDGGIGENFGNAVAISGTGDTIVVGSRNNANIGTGAGAAYALRWNGSVWVETQKLTASDGAAYHFFGTIIAMSQSGDTIVVGAQDVGRAYIERWNGSIWVETQKLVPSGGVGSLAIHGDTIVVGSPAISTGLAHILRWNGSIWVETQIIRASDGANGDRFGISVAVRGDIMVVGADATGSNTGSAYVLQWNGTIWVETQKLVASDGVAGELFGISVAINGAGDTIVVGASGGDVTYVYSSDECLFAPPMDLIFAVDSSVNVSSHWQNEVDFSIAVLNGSLQDVRVATVNFAGAISPPVVEFGLTDAPTRIDGISRLEALNLTAVLGVDGQIWTNSALMSALHVFTNASGSVGRKRVIVLVTGGVPNPGATANALGESPCSDGRVSNTLASLRSRSMNVWVLVVAVTSNMTEVRARMGCLPSNETLMFEVADYPSLTNALFVSSVRNSICQLPLVIKNATSAPTGSPSKAPSSGSPTKTPTQTPSQMPTETPSQTPSQLPTQTPSQTPTQTPSHTPSQLPTQSPSQTPTQTPSQTPSRMPSSSPPSSSPSATPSRTQSPSLSPSMFPTNVMDTSKSNANAATPVGENPSFFIPITIVLAGTLVALVGLCYSRYKSAYFRPAGVAIFLIYTFDVYSDVLFTLTLFTNALWIELGISMASLIIPAFLNILVYRKFQMRGMSDPVAADQIMEWWSRYSTAFFILQLCCGSPFGAIELVNSNLFELGFFNMGMRKKDLNAYINRRIINTLLLENVPQVSLQIWIFIRPTVFGIERIDALTNVAVVAVASGVVSVIVSMVSAWNQKKLKSLREREFIFKVVAENELIFRHYKECARRKLKKELHWNIAAALSVRESEVDVVTSPNSKGMNIVFAVRDVRSNPEEMCSKVESAVSVDEFGDQQFGVMVSRALLKKGWGTPEDFRVVISGFEWINADAFRGNSTPGADTKRYILNSTDNGRLGDHIQMTERDESGETEHV